jgi:hypothetical protein
MVSFDFDLISLKTGNIYARSYISVLNVLFAYINRTTITRHEIKCASSSVKSENICDCNEISCKLFKSYVIYVIILLNYIYDNCVEVSFLYYDLHPLV